VRERQVREGMAGLYQEMIIDHAHNPRNFGNLAGANRTVNVVNPLCGDQITLYLDLTDGAVADIAFQGNGCAISQASASLMTTAVKGLPHSDAMALFGRVHSMLTTETVDEAALVEVGKLAVLSGVWEYPARVKCATLAWQALRNALADGGRRGEKE
jgi:nitrogen fixation NifU-like protein